MPTVDALASESHYAAHLAPVLRALPREVRGELVEKPADVRGDYALVSGYYDLMTLRNEGVNVPVFFTEHGVGFSFRDRRGRVIDSYSGASDRPNVVHYLCTNDFVRRNNLATHPDTPATVVGCPKLDAWHRGSLAEVHALGEQPLVCLALHWDCLVSPGTRSAYDHFRPAFEDLARGPWTLLLHGHPRAKLRDRLTAMQLGVEYVETIEEVFERADLVVADATSAAYEFASLERPVLTLNAPWYRDEPDRGIRFWQYIPGLECDDPAQLVTSVSLALEDPPQAQALRRAAVDAAYPVRGDAAEHAARAILESIGA